MRLRNYKLIKFLPNNQLKGQYRECALIAYGIKKNGTPNHLLVNKVTEYPIEHFLNYCRLVSNEMERRGFRTTRESQFRIECLGTYREIETIFEGWHDTEYLRCNMANLWEKHFKAVGKSRITDEEWQTLLNGYKEITGEDYEI